MRFVSWTLRTFGTIVVAALMVTALWAQAPEQAAKRRPPTAEEVSRQWLTRHPRGRDEAEQRIISVMDDMQDNFQRAGVEGLVTLVEGDAHETIKTLEGPIDVVLLDAEKDGFTDYLAKLLPLARKGGLIIAHDSSGQAHMMDDYFKAITENRDLETVLVDASRWGMCITRKMQ